MSTPTLRTMPLDAISHRGNFMRRPLHAGVFVNIRAALWTEPGGQVHIDRLRREVCDTQPHRRVFAEVIAEHYQVDQDGIVSSPDLTRLHEVGMRSYAQKVEAGREGGKATAKARAEGSPSGPPKADNSRPVPGPNHSSETDF